ncbi:MAG: glycosyl transferase family protein [Novosphingobium sp.]|nr:glycosyl transferase family protein [Novosphingobium sp.]
MSSIEVLRQVLAGLHVIEHELLLFATFWFIISALDEVAFDLSWVWLRLTGRLRERKLTQAEERTPLRGRTAVLVPAWHEAKVIGHTISHMLRAWPQDELTLYVGCYRNDPETITAAMTAAASEKRLRVVIHDEDGPTTKADCLNRLYAALCTDEMRRSGRYSSVVLHDAEDMVHPAALSVIDAALVDGDFVQLPVRPEPHPTSPWIAGHYSDEFAEAHAKTLVVRDAVGAAIPAAGVGCWFSRAALEGLCEHRLAENGDGPFAAECLTEDYELGLLVSRGRSKSSFIRAHDHLGQLVATRSFFPSSLEESVKQKSRWIHGIALQGWDRLGWSGRPIELWMSLRDRRGPLTALVLAAAYTLLAIEALLGLARVAGWQNALELSPALRVMLIVCFSSFAWRAAWRCYFTGREYGLTEGFRSILRIPVANIISIMAGRRALVAYIGTLRGASVSWDKTQHSDHPATDDDRVLAR